MHPYIRADCQSDSRAAMRAHILRRLAVAIPAENASCIVEDHSLAKRGIPHRLMHLFLKRIAYAPFDQFQCFIPKRQEAALPEYPTSAVANYVKVVNRSECVCCEKGLRLVGLYCMATFACRLCDGHSRLLRHSR
jgi:hypothetical protein